MGEKEFLLATIKMDDGISVTFENKEIVPAPNIVNQEMEKEFPEPRLLQLSVRKFCLHNKQMGAVAYVSIVLRT